MLDCQTEQYQHYFLLSTCSPPSLELNTKKRAETRKIVLHSVVCPIQLHPILVMASGLLVDSLRFLNVAMVTILKNVTNLITAVGEMYLFNKHHNKEVWGSLILMLVSAISGGITDISFHSVGYSWQLLNCFCTSAYSVSSLCSDSSLCTRLDR
jgi:drug/metabolite transporter (DMT)-like permease